MKPTDTKLFAAILVPMLLIPLAGFGYAHWTDSVTKQIKLHVGYVDATIKSYKCLSEFDDGWIFREPPEDEVPVEGIKTIRIWTESAFPGWFVWIGLKIQNQGPFPVEVSVPEYTVTMTPPSSVSYTTTEYFYGPYNNFEFQDANPLVWDGLKWWELPPVPDQGPRPMPLEQYGPHTDNIMVLWIKIELTDGTEDFELTIEMTLHAVLDW